MTEHLFDIYEWNHEVF